MMRRFSTVALAAVLLVSCTVSSFAQGQAVPSQPRRPIPLESFTLTLPANISNARGLVQEMRDGRRLVLDPSTKKIRPEHRDALNIIAKEHVYVLTDKKYYLQQEPDRRNLLAPTPSELTLESRFDAADRFILVPSWNKKLTVDQADYIIYYGEAMDSAIRDILDPKPTKPGDPPPAVPQVMRINAARMLAVSAKSGAPAHFPTILSLVSNPDTDPGVLIYAIKAAEGFIAAFNPLLMGDGKYALHMVKDAEMLKLVEALDRVIRRTAPYGIPVNQGMPAPAPAAPPPPAPKAPAAAPMAPMPPMPPQAPAKAAEPTTKGEIQSQIVSPEQRRVLKYFRRAAIRAMAQCRFPKFTDPIDGKTAYPLQTLAQIAVGDPAITTTPGHDEIAYAVMGLCNLHDYKDVDFNVLCDCIAQGVVNFAGKKAGNAQDKSINWRILGSQLVTSLSDWKTIPIAANRFRNKIESLTSVLIDRVLMPLDRVGSAGQNPSLDAVARWREQNAVPQLKLFVEGNNDKVPTLKASFDPNT